MGRDPTRLTRATKGWEERLKTIEPSGGGPVTQMFRRSGPCLCEKVKEFAVVVLLFFIYLVLLQSCSHLATRLVSSCRDSQLHN